MGFSLIYTPVLHYDDINGRPLVGGKLYTYRAGTSTPATTYRNKNGTELNENPIPLNERGECVCFLEEGLDYKFVLKDKLDAVIWEQDDVSVPEGNGGGVAQVQTNWNETNTSSPAFLRNKPLVTSVTTTIEGPGDDITENVRSVNIDLNSGRVTCDQSYEAGFVAPNIAEAPSQTKLLAVGAGEDSPSWKNVDNVQKQADWEQSNSSDAGFIKNKPSLFEGFVSLGNVEPKMNSITIVSPRNSGGDNGNVTARYKVGNRLYVESLGYLVQSPNVCPGLELLDTENVVYDSDGVKSLSIESGKAYNVSVDEVNVTVQLGTLSEDTVHTIICFNTDSNNTCSVVNITWFDEALVTHEIQLNLSPTDNEFYLDLLIRKVTVENYDYSIARVYEIPHGYR